MTRREAEELNIGIEDVSESRKRLNELKAKIKALGTVNLSAIEEYSEVSERYEFMHVQVSDVEKSKAELIKLIDELTAEMREAARALEFEKAAYIRDRIKELRAGKEESEK